ncbi:hypothetical protein RSW37_26530, partial [Escherichia coli]|uniref:hypothetical protein n=1 Tax=Escherichia coli TaxID=562 RepID=UPI0028E009BF
AVQATTPGRSGRSPAGPQTDTTPGALAFAAAVKHKGVDAAEAAVDDTKTGSIAQTKAPEIVAKARKSSKGKAEALT